MIGTSIAAFGGGSAITAVVGTLIKMWDRKQEDNERKFIMAKERTKAEITALESTAHRTNNIWGNLTRFILALVPQMIMLSLLWFGYQNPDVVVWVSGQTEPQEYRALWGFFEIIIPQEITWRMFNGIVVLPALFAQMGAVNAYFLISGYFSRR